VIDPEREVIDMEVSESLKNKVFDAFNSASVGGKIRRGTNEATKAIERGNALLVAIAKDVSPENITAHIPVLCKEKGIACAEVPKKDELGKAAGLPVSTAAAAIVEIKDKKVLDAVLAEFGGKAPKPKPEKKEAKTEEPKKEEVKEAPKGEKKKEKKEAPKEEKKEAPKEAPKEEVKEKPKEEKKEAKEEKKEGKPKKE